jgi:uncharacterized lipoprotein YddW (UPF0748 family)
MKRLIITAYISLFLVSLSYAQPKREFRGVWIANVTNVDWPSAKGLSADQQKAELVAMLDLFQKQGLNAIFFQIRNACDAVYESRYEPWSEWLTGQQGQSPGYDPLAFAIQECRKRNLELHAWMNPYRAVVDANKSSIANNHISRTQPDWIKPYNTLRILDPGQPDVRKYVTEVVMDVVRRYDVDGIHFDDYFYPYPQTGFTFNDDATYKQYGRGIANRNDWRRDNIDLLVKMVNDSIRSTKPWVKFGVSPFGIWQNKSSSSLGSDTRGFESYSGIYADSRKWAERGWVDYVAPQVYWSIGNSAANFSIIVPWWVNNSFSRQLYVGHGAYKINNDTDNNWKNADEIPKQIKFNRNYPAVNGSVFFSAKTLKNNPLGVGDSLANHAFKTPALIPVMSWKDMIPPASPTRTTAKLNDDNSVTLNWAYPFTPTSEFDKPRAFVIYRGENGVIDIRTGSSMRTIVPITMPSQTSFTFTDRGVEAGKRYSYQITALDRISNESTPSDVVSPNVLTAIAPPQSTPKPMVKATTAAPQEQPSTIFQAYPNPFNRLVNLRYQLQKGGAVRLSVYDARGVRVAVLVNELQMTGTYTKSFNGEFLTDGLYTAKLELEGAVHSIKLVLQQ